MRAAARMDALLARQSIFKRYILPNKAKYFISGGTEPLGGKKRVLLELSPFAPHQSPLRQAGGVENEGGIGHQCQPEG